MLEPFPLVRRRRARVGAALTLLALSASLIAAALGPADPGRPLSLATLVLLLGG